MAVQIVLTEPMMLLANLLIQNFISAVFNHVSSMTPEEVAVALSAEQARNRTLMAELESH